MVRTRLHKVCFIIPSFTICFIVASIFRSPSVSDWKSLIDYQGWKKLFEFVDS